MSLADLLGPSPEWMANAACAEVDPDLHFPSGEHGPANMRQIWQAKAVCASCPVMGQCREYGMTEPHGVWGGLSAGERREIRAREIDHQHELARHAAVQLDHEYGRAA